VTQKSLFEQPFLRKGLPIGNLTSQLFANIYMNEFDQFMKHDLKIKQYIRYTDDFVIVSTKHDYLLDLIPKIRLYLKNSLKLDLHPSKISIRKTSQGIDFLGYIILPSYKLLRTKTKRRMLRKVNLNNLSSYRGMLMHCNGYNLDKRIKILVNLLKKYDEL